MSGANPAEVAEVGEQLCVVSPFVFTCKVTGSMDSCRLSSKVIIQISDLCGDEAKVTHAVVFDFHVLPVDL